MRATDTETQVPRQAGAATSAPRPGNDHESSGTAPRHSGTEELISSEAGTPIKTSRNGDVRPRRPLGRSLLLLVLVLLAQVGFIAAYVGVLHSSAPHELPVAVVSSDPAVQKISATLAKAPGDPVRAVGYANRAAALAAVENRDAYAALVPDDLGGTQLRVASASGAEGAQSLIEEYGKAADASHTHMEVYDDHRLPDPDSDGLSAFYLVLVWIVGGAAAAAGLALVAGSVPASAARTHARILGLLGYSVVTGIAGAVVAGPAFGLWTDNTVALAAFGSLIVFGAGISFAAVQSWLGVIGTGAAVTLFVVLSNPGGDTLFAPELLPSLLRTAQNWALPGVGTDLVRGIVYFSGNALTSNLITLWAYGIGGTAVFLTASNLRRRRHTNEPAAR